MKNLKTVAVIFWICFSFSLKANRPAVKLLTAKEKIRINSSVWNTNTIFAMRVQKQNLVKRRIAFDSQINNGYITGLKKRKENEMERALNWNFKVKFRLNKNMNIIFSYN